MGVERLQDIPDEDGVAEALKALTKERTHIKHGIPDPDGLPGTDDDGWLWSDSESDSRRAYRRLWQLTYGGGSSDANP